MNYNIEIIDTSRNKNQQSIDLTKKMCNIYARHLFQKLVIEVKKSELTTEETINNYLNENEIIYNHTHDKDLFTVVYNRGVKILFNDLIKTIDRSKKLDIILNGK
jgi:hypothetical protein